MKEQRNICRNFTLKEDTYEKLITLSKEKGFSNHTVFVVQKCIMAYYRRIDMERFNRGKTAREPIPHKLDRRNNNRYKTVHTMLTNSENTALESVIKYHNFIDKYGKAEYSQFLACVILRMWGDRDDSSEDTPKANKPGRSGLDALDPNRFINENWGGD